jgi:colicin import membrane protein
LTVSASTNGQSPAAYVWSVLLHGGLVALILLLTYTFNAPAPEPKTFELVAGDGTNYAATEAPAQGSPTGIKLDLPAMPAPPAPEPPAPAAAPPVAEAVPVPAPAPAPTPTPAKAKPTDKVPDFARTVKRTASRVASRIEAKDKKARDAAEKRRLMTEAEFRKQHPSGNKGARESMGIAGGVVGGSVANKTGGAGGKALTREQTDLLDAYFAELLQELKRNFENAKPTDISSDLSVKVGFYVAANGAISNVRILRSSGNAELDQAALDVVHHTASIGVRPDKRGDDNQTEFSMRDEEGN